MKRKLLILLLALASVFALVFGLSACGGRRSGDTNVDEERGVQFKHNIDGYDVSAITPCKKTSIVIPAEYDGRPVTSIGDFSNCNLLESITIPDSVTEIGSSAFWGCSSLTSITIPRGVTSIGEWVFCDCSSLENITVASGNTKYHSSGNCLIETATKTLKAGCKNSVIPTDGSVTSIGKYAFYGCGLLESITIPNGVTNIGNYAFVDCSKLESIIIPDSVTSIDQRAFEDCDSLTSINFAGTTAQWNAIEKGGGWDYGTGNYTIHCTDGDINK